MNTRLENQPKYKIGQEVIVKLKTRSSKVDMVFENEVVGLICQITASGTSEEDTYDYGITLDMPGCYHGGQPPFIQIQEKDILIK